MKIRFLIIWGVLAILGIFLMGCPLEEDIITVTITNSSSVSGGVGSTLTIMWGPSGEPEPEDQEVIASPSFPYEYEITDYTPDDSFAIAAVLIDAELNQAMGLDIFDTSEGGSYNSDIVLADFTK